MVHDDRGPKRTLIVGSHPVPRANIAQWTIGAVSHPNGGIARHAHHEDDRAVLFEPGVERGLIPVPD